MWKVPLFDLNYDEEEENAVLDVLRSKWLTSGPKTREFEERFSDFLGHGRTSCAVSSCTAALHLALLAGNIKKGDEVILSALSFVAAVNMVMLVGATPVLADCESPENWNISPTDLSRKITSRTKAIILVHFAGFPCEMDSLVRIAKEKNLLLIEDTAHAIGASYKNQKCGSFGDIGCFSFFSNKNLSIGEGGMFVTPHPRYDEQARLLRSHGMTSMTIDRYQTENCSYDVLLPGLNYRTSEINSALGLIQLKKLNKNNGLRKTLFQFYCQRLDNFPEFAIPWRLSPKDVESSYHIFPILLPKNTDRKRIMNGLTDKGIQASVHYPAYKQFSYYKSLISDIPKIANEISSRVLTLPLYPTMTLEMVDYVCDSLVKLTNNVP